LDGLKKEREMSRARRILGVTVFFAVFTAAAAAIGGGITIVTKTTADLGGPTTSQAKCDQQDQVLGGGFSAPDGNNIAQQSHPVGDRSWRAEMLSEPGDITAYALCEPASARKLKAVSKTISVPHPSDPDSTAERAVSAKCPENWKVVSGGYAVDPPYSGKGPGVPAGEIAVDTSKRVKSRKWKVHGGNDGAKTDLIAFALCEKSGFSHIEQVHETSPTTKTVQASAVAQCPKGTHIVGGGFQTKPDEAHNSFPEVSASMPIGSRKWESKYLPEKDGSLTSFAECEKN
jgi:hypothetical protein